MIKDGNTYQLITDYLGSIRLVVDVISGIIAQQIDYDEYGNIISDSNPDFQPFAYAGGMYDTQSKLVRFGARDYDASADRWTAKDPIGFDGGYSNLFEYVSDDAVNYLDPDGTIKLHTKGAANQQIEMFSNGFLLAYRDIAQNDKAKEYFSRFGIDIMDALSPGSGPDVYLTPEDNGDYGRYYPNRDKIEINTFGSEQEVASTLVHEMAHWANKKGKKHNPNICDIKFNSPNTADPSEGYAAEVVVFGFIYSIGGI